jgi:hypothetical protein
VHVKLCDVEVLVDALVVGLESLDLWKLAMNGGALRRIAFGGWVVGWRWGGIVAVGA